MADEVLAVDANVLVAAMMGGRTRELIARARRAGIDLVAPEEVFQEVEEHLVELAEFVGARADQFKLALWSMPVRRAERSRYERNLKRAMDLVGGRDPDDVPLVALALSLGAPIWSNDRDVAGIRGLAVFTTRDVAGTLPE